MTYKDAADERASGVDEEQQRNAISHSPLFFPLSGLVTNRETTTDACIDSNCSMQTIYECHVAYSRNDCQHGAMNACMTG